MKTKICVICFKRKSFFKFYKTFTKRGVGGVRGECKICYQIKRKNNPKRIAWSKKYNESHKKQRNMWMRKWHLKRYYNLSFIDYKKMVKQQNKKCAICQTSEKIYNKKLKKYRRLGVDHDHKTGKIRGLLCSKCNRGIGYFNENIKLFKNAIKYLKG